MVLTNEEQTLIKQEVDILDKVVASLKEQKEHYQDRSKVESMRARELTAGIVATRRVEDRAQLSSDEAVSHALEVRNLSEIKRLTKLVQKPYFARIVLEEEKDDGKTKEIEYKIGFAANPDCRIIDWRKAPISKLFYEYREGDDYSEQIQGIERNGRVALRNTVDIENSKIKNFSCSIGTFECKNGEWQKSGAAARTENLQARDRMRDVLALITKDQFRTITEDAKSAILIQGIAGSGKTTVALHRLAWLLEPENSELNADECLIIVQTASLRTYVENTMPELGITGVKAITLNDWMRGIIVQITPNFSNEAKQIVRPETSCPSSIERVKKSIALLNCLEERGWNAAEQKSYAEILLETLSDADQIIRHDETRLLDKEIIARAAQRSKENFQEGCLDFCDDALFVRMHELRHKNLPMPHTAPGKYKHLVVDEVQDLSSVDLAAVIGAVEDIKDLTIVGDSSQSMDTQRSFPGWDRLRRFWDHKDAISTFVELNVSHRSTLPIMKLADHIQSRQLVTSGRPGRVPIWFKCQNENKGLESVITWLTTALERFPNALTAVVCANETEAKYALSMLRPTFGGSVRIGSSDSFSFEAGILVTDIKQVKGLEFFNVLIWNPSDKLYPAQDPVNRNLLYIAVTRAEENLCLVSWGKPCAFLPHIDSKLVRGYKVNEEPVEE